MTDTNLTHNLKKEDFGYQESDKKFYFTTNEHIPKGSFRVKRKKDEYYWYFARRNEKGKVIDKYLGKAFLGENKDGLTSFQDALRTLTSRHNDNFHSVKIKQRRITKYIDEYMEHNIQLMEEDGGLKKPTLLQHNNGVRVFKNYLLGKKYRLYNIEQVNKWRLVIRDYTLHLVKTSNRNGSPYTPLTISTYLKNVKVFHEWLTDKEFGKGVVEVNPITSDFYRKLKDKLIPKTQKRFDRRNSYFSKESYEVMLSDCVTEVGNLWRDFNENDGYIKREFINQPDNVVGSNVVWFISLLQLSLGFRVGEVLTSYRSEEDWNKRIDKKNSSTFWFKQKGVWILELDWKGKGSVVPTNDLERLTIRTWKKPIGWKGKPSGFNGKEGYFDTHIIDVARTMFRDSPFLFSSPNHSSHNMRHYSVSQYSMNFKKKCVVDKGWEKFGIKSSHDLRDAFITYNVQQGVDPFLLCQITRHKISTMKYYKRENIDSQQSISKDIGITLGKYKPIRHKEIHNFNED